MERKTTQVDCPFSADLTDSDTFYVTFWSLQKYLKNPTILHSQQVLDEFKPKLDFVINKFFAIEQERLKLRGQAAINKTSAPEQKMDIVLGSEDKSEFYPGFLKSRQLFDLQVSPSRSRVANGKDGRFKISKNSIIPNYGRNETPPFPNRIRKRET
jgi:hypothetical protein